MSATAPGLTARQPFQTEPATTPNAVPFHRFQKITGAGGFKSTTRAGTTERREQRRNRPLVKANKNAENFQHEVARIEARLARRNHSTFNC